MKHTIKGYVTYEKPKWATKPRIDFWTVKPERVDGLVVIKEHSFEVDIPDDFDPRPGMVDALRKQEAQARSEFQARITDIHRQISELQAIEYSQA